MCAPVNNEFMPKPPDYFHEIFKTKTIHIEKMVERKIIIRLKVITSFKYFSNEGLIPKSFSKALSIDPKNQCLGNLQK